MFALSYRNIPINSKPLYLHLQQLNLFPKVFTLNYILDFSFISTEYEFKVISKIEKR